MVFEVVGQILFELLTELGWRSLGDGLRSRREAHPVLARLGQFLLGSIAGVISLLIVSRRIVGPSPLVGASLILSPLCTGLAMHWIGEWWPRSYGDKPGLFSFTSGAIFAFGMALVRFVYLENPLGWWPR
jgi:hypothetical protein